MRRISAQTKGANSEISAAETKRRPSDQNTKRGCHQRAGAEELKRVKYHLSRGFE